MDRNFNRAVVATLKYEGGYVNDPQDPGGATNKGITIATFRRYIKPTGTIADLKALTTEQAKIVYKRQYWDAVLGSELPDGLDFAVFDFGVNSGPDRAIKYLQRIVGAAQDGKIGPATLKAVRSVPHAKIINDYQDARLAFLKGLKTWGRFGKGWGRRVQEVRSLALSMAANPSTAYTPKPSVPELLKEEAAKPVIPAPVAKPSIWALVFAFIARLLGKK